MSGLSTSFKRIFARFSPSMLALSAFSAFCTVCGGFACDKIPFTQLKFAGRVPLARLILLTMLLTVLLTALGLWRRHLLCRVAPLCALFYGIVCCAHTASFYTAFGFLILLSILLIFVLRQDRIAADSIRLPRWLGVTVIALFAAIMAAYLISAALMRYFAYNSPCYDFGIFAQMFHSMRTTGVPVTTCEREEAMSHFAVHISPFFYLLLPFYMIIPRPETLLILQVLGVLSGVIPLYLLTRHFKLSEGQSITLCLLYLGCAALTGGIFYDFHENKFLTVLILWLMWSIERKKLPLTVLFALLTLSVKEDAAIYVLFIGLWMLLCRREKIVGLVLSIGSAGYFIAVTRWLSEYGDGAMFNRFSNIIGQGGIRDLIRTALTNPALLLNECMNAEKLVFAACILLPLGFLPLMTKKLSSLILICPMVIVNLISDYTYQHNLDFQYAYGVMALLFYLSAANLPHISDFASGFRTRRALICFALCASALIGTVQIRNHSAVFRYYTERRDDSAVITETLAAIPTGASVRTSSMFAAHLASREKLYYLTNEKDADYVALDLRPYISINSARGYDVEYFERLGYELIAQTEDVIALLRKP